MLHSVAAAVARFGFNRGMTPTDDITATRARERFASQVRLGFIAMLSLCVVMLLIHG